MGLHTGLGRLGGDNYVGLDVHRAARLMGRRHRGQIVLSESTFALVRDHRPAGVGFLDLGAQRLKDLAYAGRRPSAASRCMSRGRRPGRCLR